MQKVYYKLSYNDTYITVLINTQQNSLSPVLSKMVTSKAVTSVVVDGKVLIQQCTLSLDTIHAQRNDYNSGLCSVVVRCRSTF